MKKSLLIIGLSFAFLSLFSQERNDNCTSVLVSKGASRDGSVMITYACDAEFVSLMRHLPA
ncbi:MAG: hypothetical protein HOC82_03255, partial [Bacteroidetes bacterium]|nr:hypothetical protein [Bacteroidota bacterium]